MNTKKLSKPVKLSLWVDASTMSNINELCCVFDISMSKLIRASIFYANETRAHFDGYIKRKSPRLLDISNEDMEKIIQIAKTKWIND